MSFLIRRNLPLAWAGYRDSFERPIENPVQRPWFHIGDGPTADINALGELHIPSNYLTVDGGGESYAFQPFTPNWGYEFRVWFPVEGAAAQPFSVYFTDSWTKVAPNKFENCIGIRLLHEVAGDNIQYAEFANTMGVAGNLQSWSSPVGRFKGQYVTVKIWCENDEWFRIWVNGNYVGSKTCSPSYKLGPGRRCMRFLNAALCDAWVTETDHYDRPPTMPPKTVWNSVVYDDFNRADGPVGNGWTVVGNRQRITSNSWGRNPSDGNDSGVAILRDTGDTAARVRVEATAGGAMAVQPDRSSGLVIGSNSTGTSGLIATIQSDSVAISEFTTSLDNNLPTLVQRQSIAANVFSTDKIAFSSYNGITWIEQNGTPILYSNGWVTGGGGAYAGLYAERKDSTNSHSWNDVRISLGLG